MSKNVIFHIEGGLGKNVVATSVIRSYKKQNPDHDIIVTTAYPDIFQHNENVKRSYLLGYTPYFYEDFILNKDVEIFAHDPYRTTSHITKSNHITKTWCNMVGVEYDENPHDIQFNFSEVEYCHNLIKRGNKPTLLFQPFGGPQNQQHNYSWMRDIHPIAAQKIVDILKDQYDIYHVCHQHHPHLKDVIRIDQNLNKKILCGLVGLFNRRILIDSSLQHASYAIGVKSTVVWVATQPEVFGYDTNKNVKPILSFPKGTIESYLYDYNFTGTISESPYKNIDQIFNINDIIS